MSDSAVLELTAPGGRVIARHVWCECCQGRGRHRRANVPIACGSILCSWCAGTGRRKELMRIPSGTRSLDSFDTSRPRAESDS